jgi:UDP-N-acetylmuramyl pentapeptide phosphotransferase/UDP-N-acetylglucosamine-1-phosphate transferase
MLIRILTFGGTFALSLAFALYLTPFIRRGALAFGVLDRPDGVLKRPAAPVPYLGGIAAYLAFLLTLSIVFSFSKELLGLLLGGTMLAMLGLFDDLRVIAPRLKLAGQLIATWVMLRCDIAIQVVALPPSVTIPLTILWLVGITNAINILDVSDGLATGVAAIAALAFFVIAVVDGDLAMAVTTLALVGALVGFLRYNQPPAQRRLRSISVTPALSSSASCWVRWRSPAPMPNATKRRSWHRWPSSACRSSRRRSWSSLASPAAARRFPAATITWPPG